MSLLSKLGDLKEMKEQALAMQGLLAQEKIASEYHGIVIVMNGNQEILELTIPEESLKNKTELENDLKNALGESLKKVQRLMASKLGGLI
jgi:DNA-binding protein YbaB